MNETKVWIRKRKLASGKQSYHLRWICPQAKQWKSRKIGTDKKMADRARIKLEQELEEGTYRNVLRITWDNLVEDHVAKIIGKCDAVESKKALTEFGKVCSITDPRRITYSHVEQFVSFLRNKEKPNAIATVNKKLRYLRSAFKKAIRRGYMVRNPLDGWTWKRENRKAIRIVTEAEEVAILNACECLYGNRWWCFVYVSLMTGGRRSELLNLTWENMNFDEGLARQRGLWNWRDAFAAVFEGDSECVELADAFSTMRSACFGVAMLCDTDSLNHIRQQFAPCRARQPSRLNGRMRSSA